MPVIPTYTKREFIKTPGVDASAPAPVRLAAAYENDLTRTSALLPQALGAAGRAGGGSPAGEKVVSSAASADENLSLRKTLAGVVEKEMAAGPEAGFVALERVAAGHFTSQTAAGSAARDYAVLRRAVQEARQTADFAQAKELADTEKTLTRQVGALVRSPEALDEYLSGQLACYEERLRAAGENEASVRAHALCVRAQTVEDNVCRSLVCGDWYAAEATLSKHGDKLADSVRQACAAKTGALFARSQAQKLWEEARLETGGPAEAVHRAALERATEPDEALNASVRQTLEAVYRRESAREHLSSAQTLAEAARTSSAQALRLLDGTTALPAQEEDALRRAALFLDGDVTRSDAGRFVACYFDGTQKEHVRLWKREQLSARDYIRLEAARHRRAGGESQRVQELACRAIDVWMRKKGFSAQDVQTAQYAVLTADAPNESLGDVWKQIKNLLDV